MKYESLAFDLHQWQTVRDEKLLSYPLTEYGNSLKQES